MSMAFEFKKRYLLPVVGASCLAIGAGVKEDFFEVAKQLEIFTHLFKEVNQNYVDETNPGALMTHAIKSMLTELDPYTVFFNEADVVKFKINSSGEYTGIGAMINRNEGKLTIVEPYKGYAADRAGLKAGDEITKIGDIVVADFKEDAGELLRGSKNDKVPIEYKRQNKIYTTELVLDGVEIKAVPFFGMIDNETGYIVLSQFNRRTTVETKDALQQLKRQGAKKIVLDLRGNPGGLLHEAVNICNLFVPKDAIIVTTQSKLEKHNNVYRTTREPEDLTIPLAILVDGHSASASEIVAGALQDLDRAVVIGSRSFGKGLVQRPIDLSYGTQLKITISRYYTPSGRCIQALDYSHRDDKGKAVKNQTFNAYKTKKGRTVYDGGGIQPDIELAESKNSAIAAGLISNNAIFNFATEYYYAHPNVKDGIPTITDADFTQFKTFLKRTKVEMNTQTEFQLKKTLEVAQIENIDKQIAQNYQQLLAAVQQAEEGQLDQQKEEIKKLLRDELIKRYAYKEGLYQFYMKNSPEVQRAAKVLNQSSEYNNILRN